MGYGSVSFQTYLLEVSGFESEGGPNFTLPYSLAEDEENINCEVGTLSALLRPKPNIGAAASVFLVEAILTPMSNIGEEFDSFGGVALSDVKFATVSRTVGSTVVLGEDVLWNIRLVLFSAVRDPAKVPTSVFWFISDAAGLISVKAEALSTLTSSDALLFLSTKEEYTFSVPSANEMDAAPFGQLSSSKSTKSCKQYP